MFGFVHKLADSMAAASGKHKKVKSLSLIKRWRSFVSFLSSSEIDKISISLRFSNLSKIFKPVVPSFPSIKTLYAIVLESSKKN